MAKVLKVTKVSNEANPVLSFRSFREFSSNKSIHRLYPSDINIPKTTEMQTFRFFVLFFKREKRFYLNIDDMLSMFLFVRRISRKKCIYVHSVTKNDVRCFTNFICDKTTWRQNISNCFLLLFVLPLSDVNVWKCRCSISSAIPKKNKFKLCKGLARYVRIKFVSNASNVRLSRCFQHSTSQSSVKISLRSMLNAV